MCSGWPANAGLRLYASSKSYFKIEGDLLKEEEEACEGLLYWKKFAAGPLWIGLDAGGAARFLFRAAEASGNKAVE